jgi:hypothetical protein
VSKKQGHRASSVDGPFSCGRGGATRDFKMRQGGFRVSITTAGHHRPASTYTSDKDVNLMPNIDVNSPVSSAPTDRLALGVGWVRPGVTGIGGTLNPSGYNSGAYCFEANE